MKNINKELTFEEKLKYLEDNYDDLSVRDRARVEELDRIKQLSKEIGGIEIE